MVQSRATKMIIRGMEYLSYEDRLRIDSGKEEIFTLRVRRHWKRSPKEAVDAPFLEVSKARTHGALSNLVWWEVFLHMAGGLELDDL